MTAFIQTVKRNIYGITALLLVASVALPALAASTVSAEQITERSIEMSTSSPSVIGVSYTLRFNPGQAGTVDAIVIDFCAESAVIGTACTKPTGMSPGTTLTTLTNNGSDINGDEDWAADIVTSGDAVYIYNDDGFTANTAHQVVATLSDFVNTSTVGTFYARILTYGSPAAADAYESEDVGSPIDTGGVALSTVEDIDVTAFVSESLTFCVAGEPIDPGCGGSPAPADLTLGEGDPGEQALSTSVISEAIAYFQLSTNAAGATAIKLRNGAASGGMNSGTNSIPPIDEATPQVLGAGTAGFGVRVPLSTAGDGGVPVLGTTEYGSNTADALNMTSDATSPYGAEIANTDTGGPVSNANVPLTIGAQASNLTAAGIYTAVLVLIATSTY